jgi:hypothetical protein
MAVRPSGAAYVLGKTNYTYSTQAQPAKNGSYVDGTYGTTVTRVTHSAAEHGQASGTGCGYSTWSPESSDGNWLVFNTIASVTGIQSGGYALYTGAGTYVRMLTNYIQSWNGQDPEPRWDTSGFHPSWLYYRKDKQLRYVDVSNNTDHLVRDFSNEFPASGYYIYTGEEGTPSDDSRYWAFMVDNANAPYAASHIFVYDKTNNVVVASKSISGHEPNNVTMSRSGAYVYVAYDWTGANNEYDGPHAYRRTLTTPVKMCSGIPHAVPAYSKQGNDVMFFMNSTAEGSDMVSIVRMDNGAVTNLCYQGDLGWDGSNLLHTAPGITKKGWGFVSTYSRLSEGGNNHWSDNQIFAIELDETNECGTATEPRIWRLSFTQNMPNESYYYNQPNAQMNLAGTKLWWGANWRNVNGVCEVYRIDLPQNWYTDLGGTITATVPNAPTTMTAAATSPQAIQLHWVDTASDETGFTIERKTVAGSYGAVANVNMNTSEYVDEGLNPGTTYYYRVQAFNNAASSGYSNEAVAATQLFYGDITGNQDTVAAGEIKIVGSAKWRGAVNPDEGDTAKIYFVGSATGTFEVKIFTLTGELVWEDKMDNVQQGMFEWWPRDVASGGYVVLVRGPGLNAKKKMAILR